MDGIVTQDLELLEPEAREEAVPQRGEAAGEEEEKGEEKEDLELSLISLET